MKSMKLSHPFVNVNLHRHEAFKDYYLNINWKKVTQTYYFKNASPCFHLKPNKRIQKIYQTLDRGAKLRHLYSP